jgi:FkbM family methyltransferase
VQTRPLKCGVITPVGPGHEALADEARASVEAAFERNPGPFSELVFLRELDLQGERGRSRSRNDAIDAALARGIDWLFFLDADDLMAPHAFASVVRYINESDAIFGLIAEAKFGGENDVKLRANQLGATETISDILFFDPFLTLQMGHFVRTDVAAKIRFDADMDTGEDFKYYLELWKQARCRKIDQFLFINRRGAHSTGPRSADGGAWRSAVARVFEDFCARYPVTVSFSWEGRPVYFALGNPMDLIHRHFITGKFFEADELTYLRQIVPPHSTILEIGANVGNHVVYYSLFMQPAKIIPVEPNPAAIVLLLQNVVQNQIGNLDLSLLGFGLGAERGRFKLSLADNVNIGAARLTPSEEGDVEVYPLDEKFQGEVDFVKIDVEWMEMEVLRGMENLINNSRPTLFVEVMNSNVPSFMEWVAAHNYKIVRTFPYINAKNFVAVRADHPLAAVAA